MSIMMVIEMMGVDMTDAAAVSHMISFSVRWAVPFIFLVVAIPALQALFPGPLPMWLLRNRKYIGMCFAVAMAWQGLFIFMMSNFFRDYYFEEIFYLRDELEGSTGYIFLAAMVVTSFKFGRKHLNGNQWKLLHRSALYYLWAYPFSVYWWNLSYYESPQTIDYVFYWSGFLAFALRIAAWGKKRRQAAFGNAPESNAPFAFKISGGVLIALGLFVASTVCNGKSRLPIFCSRPRGRRILCCGYRTGLLSPICHFSLLDWVPCWQQRPETEVSGECKKRAGYVLKN